MRYLFSLFLLIITFNCNAQSYLELDEELELYIKSHTENQKQSISTGTVSKGKLKHGKLFPYKGGNFIYFDRESYLEGRAFLHGSVKTAVLQMYDSLHTVLPNRYFTIMECSNETGGPLLPHRTHQNGRSIDFMMPLKKSNKPYYKLDTLGAKHYTLNFTDNGKYTRDETVEIDFNLMARQILILDYCARKQHFKISKVIIKIELKDELFNTVYGQILEASNIYIVQKLTPLINALHDDHFHVDFESI